MVAQLPTYISLAEASNRYSVRRRELTQLIDSGRIRAVKINGDVAVAEEDVKRLPVSPPVHGIPAPNDEMKGRAIRAREAIKKYRIASHSTLAGWRERNIVRVIKQDHKHVTYDEYTVAIAAQAYHASEKKQGIRYPKFA